MNFTFEDLHYCAKECERQKSGEMSVMGMLLALDYLRVKKETSISPELIISLGKIIEPGKNQKGYRQVPVTVNGNLALPHAHIPRAIEMLCDSSLDALEFYKEFELIHPFIDGNGRVGSLLYNYKLNKINEPGDAPDIFKK